MSRIKAPTTIKKLDLSKTIRDKLVDSSLMPSATPKKHTSRNLTNDSQNFSHSKTERQSLMQPTSKLMIEPMAQTPKKQTAIK